ncbi:MAG: MFS transporter [Candidatus Latescibacteria bacterium]|nr:MFS transporter [Candidatus Latescibacterota bacterium]
MTKAQSTGQVETSRLIRSFPFFYGWVNLAVSGLGLIMTSPGQTYAVSIFIESFIEDLGLSRSMVSTLYAVGTLGGSLALPLMGRSIDRYGVRKIGTAVSIFFGLSCIFMGFAENAAMLGIGFVGLRMLGQGSLYLVCLNAINRWWVRRRGEAIGVSGLITSIIAMGLTPGLIDGMIPEFGWRTTYMILGGVLLAFMAPMALIFIRDQPEKYGLHPDGVPLADSMGNKVHVAEVHWTLKEAFRTTTFWVVMLGSSCSAMLSTGLMFHMVGIVTDHGMSASVAAWLYLPLSITTAVVTLASGMLLERVSIARMMGLSQFLLALSLLMAPYLQGYSLAVTYGVILGASGGLSRTIGGVAWAHFYGRQYLGSITGMTTGIGIASSALGPMVFGVARDLAGSYGTVLMASAVLPLALGFASPLISHPEKER